MDLLKIDLADFGNLFRTAPAKLSEQELLSLDFILHQAWKHKRAGGNVHFGNKSWSFEDMVNLHALVRQEMAARGFQHTVKDELDDQTQPFLKDESDCVEFFNPYHDESGRFASGSESGSGGGSGGNAGGVTNAAAARIDTAIKEAHDIKLEEQDTAFRYVGDKNANHSLAKEHNEFISDFKEGTVDDVNSLAGKILAGNATPSELGQFKKRIGNNAEDYVVDRYSITQELLRQKGIKEATIYRGINGQQAEQIKAAAKQGKNIEIATRSIASFSTSRAIAEDYTSAPQQKGKSKGVVIKVTVPASQIFAHYKVEDDFNGWGEKEVVLWNPTSKLKVSKKDVFFKDEKASVNIGIDDSENANWLRAWVKDNQGQSQKSGGGEQLAPVHSSGIELGREITLDEVLPQIKSFYAHPIFAWIVGGLANWGKTKGDIDVLWWATPAIPEYLKKILEFRFGRQFSDNEISGRVQHHLNYFQGPFTKAVPIYALKVERINPKGEVKEAAVHDIGFKADPVDLVWDETHKGWTLPDSLFKTPTVPEPPVQEKQLRSATAEIEAQAETSAKENAVKLFRFFYPLKPTRGHKPDEPQSVDAFLRFFKDADFPVYSSKKFDGADYVIFRDGDRVQMISEDGRENTDRFPKMVATLKSLPVARFAILAEVERWNGDKHLPRETVIAYVNNASEPDDSDFIANVYDVVFFESDIAKAGDIHNLPFIDRLKFLDSLGLPQSTDNPPDLALKLNKVSHYPAGDKEELRSQTEKLRRLEGSEGNVASTHDSTYNLENKPSGKIKFHNAAVLRGIITEAKETKTPDIFNFFYGLDFQNMKVPSETIKSIKGRLYHEIGTTFSTSLTADVGDVIDVEFETLNATRNLANGTISVSAWAPRVLGISKKSQAMTIGEAMKAAREGFVLQEKEITDTGETIYKGVRQAFGSYGGKRFLAHRIASYIPHHRTYVEPFAGGAAVLYAKDPSPQEALNDRDAEIAFMHKFIRDHSPEDRNALAKREWTIRRETHERLKAMKPATDRDRFYKAFYLTRSSYGKMRGGSFNPANEGVKIDFPNTVERAQARLRNVAITNKDYLQVLKEHDGPETFFYMDPPYPDKFNLFDFGFKEDDFLRAVKSLKAKWIISYPSEHAKVFKGYHVYIVKRRNQMRGPGGNKEWVTELMASNFPLKPLHLYIEKELEPEPEGMEDNTPPFLPHLEDESDMEKVHGAFKSPGGKYRLYKKILALIPEHKTFVEAFCGGAQVFFHKKRSEQEIINDVNSDLIFAYRFIKSMTPEDLDWLKKQEWVIHRSRARKLFESKPKTPRERFYRFSYLNKATYWGRTDSWEGIRTGRNGEGYHIKLPQKLPDIQERLKNVKLHSWDWQDILKEYDSENTFFYLDPPYPIHWPKEGGDHGAKFFKEEDLIPALKRIKGKFILSYELEKMGLFKGFKTYRVKTLWTGMHQLGVRHKYELLVSNFPLKPANLYLEKSLEPVIKQDEIFNVNPPEEETYKYTMQSHWRGMSEHKDFRIESLGKEFLVGWTLADLVEGIVKEPVETLAAAKKWSDNGSAFKIDFKTGKFKERRTRAGNIVPADIRAFPKAKEPHVWLDVEGVTPPFPAPGATKQYRGVFIIEDAGSAEYGVQKPDVHEYFLHGKLKGRLVVRRLAREALQESSKVLPPGKVDEAPITTTTLWVAIQPLDQTPIVLTEREVEKKWIPPFGISALPMAVRKLIPPKFQYWKVENRADSLKIRDDLAVALSSEEIKIDFNRVILDEAIEKQTPVKVPFVLQYQTFRGPIVVRQGPSKEIWTLRIATAPDRVLAFQLSGDPTKSQTLSATLKFERTNAYMKVEGDLPPGSPLNPTKDTPSSIVITDKGGVLVLNDNNTFKKFEFRGDKLRDLWIARRPDVVGVLWEFAQSSQVTTTV